MESLETRALLAAIIMTDFEQLMIENINRARLNPLAEAARFEIDLNDGLPAGTISSTPKQPLAPHQALVQAAQLHSQDMVDRDFFDHTNPDGKDPGQRMSEAGYAGARMWGENIAEDFSVNAMHRSLFDSPPHRTNIMNPGFEEIGVGIVDWIPGISYAGTENFGARNGDSFITGVAFSDQLDGDDFFSPGEGLNNVTITATRVNTTTSFTTVTGPTGGYALQVPAGTYNVKAEGGELDAPLVFNNVVIGSENVKVDFVVPFVPPSADPFEPNDEFGIATELDGGDHQLLGLSITESDIDIFRWTAPASGTLTVTLDLTRDAGDIGLALWLETRPLAFSWTENPIEQIVYEVTAGTTYFIRIYSDLGFLHRDYDLVIDGPGAAADKYEPNNNRETAVDVTAGDQTLAELTIHAPNDLDYFRWSPATHGPFDVQLTYDADEAGLELHLLNGSGQVIDTSNEFDGSETVSGIGQAGGDYYVRVTANNGAIHSGYQLQFSDTTAPLARSDRTMTEMQQTVRIAVLSNDVASNEQWDMQSLRIDALPRFGTATIDVTAGEIVYQPPGDQRGSVRLHYSVADAYGNRTAVAALDIAVLDLNNRPWTNPDLALDVDASGSVTPFDATLLLRELKVNGNRQFLVPSLETGFPAPYLDPNGDGRSTPQDALTVVSHLRRLSEGEALEGEADQENSLWLESSPLESYLLAANERPAPLAPRTREDEQRARNVDRVLQGVADWRSEGLPRRLLASANAFTVTNAFE